MADPRFFKKPVPLSLGEIAAKIGATLANTADADFIIHDIAALDTAKEGDLAFLDNKKYREQFAKTKASAVIIHPDMAEFAPTGARLIVSPAPYTAYARAAQLFYPDVKPAPQIAATALIHPSVKIGKNVHVADFVVIGENAEIGDDVWIEPHAVIGDGVIVGDACRIGSHVSLTHAILGKNVRLYTGVRIGQDGFGFAMDPTGFVKVPQLGRVVIGTNVEVGANSTIDRGASGDTTIGDGVWIDNMVHIAHNVKIGRGCVIVAQAGIAGSTELGDFVVVAGQVGISGHLKIGSMAKVAAKSGVTKDIPAKEEWMGYPAMPMKQFLRQAVTLTRITDKPKK